MIDIFLYFIWSILDHKIEETNNKIENSFLKFFLRILKEIKTEIVILADII